MLRGRNSFNYIYKQAPVGTGMSRARNSRWGMLLYVNEAGIYGGQNKIGVHVYMYHVGIDIVYNDNLSK